MGIPVNANEPAPDKGEHRSQPNGRRRSLQHPLDRALFHPLACRLAHLLTPTRATPNMVSIAGGVAVVLAGFAYAQQYWPLSVVLGLAFHLAWHVLDGADGDLARLTGQVSANGEAIDGVCDYAGHTALYVTLAWAWQAEAGWSIWALVIGAGASRIVQANYYETRRRQYLRWVYGVPWLRTARDRNANLPFRMLTAPYLRLAERIAPAGATLDALFEHPEGGASARARLEARGPSSLSGGTLLGANDRTIALGVSMLIGSPVWYFLYEIVVLNVALVVAGVRARRTLDTFRGANQPPSSAMR